ncbi:MAG TPA: ring-cleaving dioxygenase [Terriglobales bacterium]|nr:ring-cleaving dioxygenase [Terriglobales bacterium]
MPSIEGIHHVTAIAGEPQPNINFYAGILGLRLVKVTVNFDDPTTYHFYYGDGQGHPGTIMTFFPWPGAFPGRIGTGQLTVTSFAVPEKSLPYWRERLRHRNIEFADARSDFGEEMLFLRDPDGLQLELISTPNAEPDRIWERGPVPTEHAIRGFHHATLSENGYERTASLLTSTLGFKEVDQQGNRFRYAAGNGAPGTIVDLLCAPEGRPGRVAVGTVHHIAWRTPSDVEHAQWRDTLSASEYDVTPIIDRQYFHSIYFREPGGVLFEIATDPPGFAIDESIEHLGSSLKLPPQFEHARSELERVLPHIELPTIGGGQADEAA